MNTPNNPNKMTVSDSLLNSYGNLNESTNGIDQAIKLTKGVTKLILQFYRFLIIEIMIQIKRIGRSQ